MPSSIEKIAELVGVSATTISRAFSGKGYVSEETREKIMQAAQEIAYQPKQYKKRTNTVFSNKLGVVIPDICNTYYMEVIHGIESITEKHGVEVLICNTDEDPNKEIRCLNMLEEIKVNGVIAVPVSEAEKYNAEYLIHMNSSGIPVVLLDRDLANCNIDGVFMDNFNSAYQGVRKFIQNGHTEIAIICGPLTSTSGLARLNGYKAALQEHHIPIREEYILYGDFKFELAYHLTKEFVAQKTNVTAIFAANSRMSMGCLFALTEMGLSVPEDIAFISCGRLGLEYSRISSIVYPTMAIGAECARILLEKMQAGKKQAACPKKRTTFEMEWLLRGSERFPANRR